jgi:hypothetical protein
MRLVKKLPGPMMTASKPRIASSTVGESRRPAPARAAVPAALLQPRVDFDLAARLGPIGELGAHRCRLDAYGPYAALASQQAAEAIDGSQKVAAVLLHHREQQVSTVCPAEPRVMLERRQA